MALSKLSSVWESYLQKLDQNPVHTKALTAAVLSGLSDVLAQYMEQKPRGTKTSFKTTSFINQVLIGYLFRGPVVHYWYLMLEKLFASWDPAAVSTAVAKTAVDQIFFSPIFGLLYFYLVGFLQGQSRQEIEKKIAREYKKVMIMNYRIWPLANLLNFYVVPPKLRVLFGNLVAVFWTAYLIMITSEK